MRRVIALVLGAAFVAALPAAASAAKAKRYKHHPRHVAVEQYPDSAGPRFVADALHQLIVPWQVTFAPPPPPPEPRRRYVR
jgi:hypothetical protein